MNIDEIYTIIVICSIPMIQVILLYFVQKQQRSKIETGDCVMCLMFATILSPLWPLFLFTPLIYFIFVLIPKLIIAKITKR